MKIQVNGEAREMPESTTIADLLQTLKLDPKFLAVERNQQLVPRTQHTTSLLESGDVLEIVTLVGGG